MNEIEQMEYTNRQMSSSCERNAIVELFSLILLKPGTDHSKLLSQLVRGRRSGLAGSSALRRSGDGAS